ncbi:hypothetical protein ACIQLR_003233 [Photobacterium damselae]
MSLHESKLDLMTSNCKEFNFLIDRKAVYSSNDIPSLVAYNKCLINEIDTLNGKIGSLEKDNQANADKLVEIKEQLSAKIDIQKAHIDSIEATSLARIESLQSMHEITAGNFTSMYESNQNNYGHTLTALSLIIAIAGVFAFLTLKSYKKREINELKDDTLTKVTNALENENYTQVLVARAIDSVFIGDILDEKLEEVADDIERRVLNVLQDRDMFDVASTPHQESEEQLELKDILDNPR